MRAGLSTIQQTLTPDAANILTLSIAEAARRNHGQTTPLHVAATLLSSPTGLLRQACIKSHPNSSHPLQCRALELCFSVALDRLPASNNSGSDNNLEEPPISNALMAALKRAQAHQRRGCPEQQQSPLLAVKVELEQLVVSILDDPSVSRVMKEASFSSPSVKSAIEQSITPSPSLAPSLSTTSSIGPVRNLYMNPRLVQPQNQFRKKEEVGGGDVKKVMEILMRSRKRNPILVGDSDLSCMLKEVIERIQRRELGSCVRIISLEKEFGFSEKVQIQEKVKELKGIIGNCKNDGVVINLGNLKWLVDFNGGLSGKGASDTGKEVVSEMKGILGNGGKVWVIGTATCATYLRCQVYFPNMEVDWDLQAVPIAPRAPTASGLFPRLGNNDGVLSSSIGPSPINKGFPMIKPTLVPLKWPPEKRLSDNSQKQALCTQCTEKYEHELGKLVSQEFEKPSTDTNLPQWLQMATPSSIKPSHDQFQNKERDHNWKKNTDELLEKWRTNCSRLHSSNISTINPLLLQQSSSVPRGFPQLRTSPPPSPVRTDLALGIPKPSNISPFENVHKERFPLRTNIPNFDDSDSLKRVYKGLIEKVSWQTEAASAVAAAVLKSKSVSSRKHGQLPKTDTWLLFIGSDKLGKRKMANALSDLLFGVESTVVSSEKNYHGKTALNHIVDSAKTNPSSVILIEDIDRRDEVFRSTIKRAIETGRLPDSYGREVTLRSTIFVLTANWLPENDKCSNDLLLAEERVLNSVHSNWELEVSIVGEKKRLPDWLLREENSTKRVKEKDKLGLGLSLNLNLAISSEPENSSDLTSECEQDHGRLAIKHRMVSSATEFVECVDNAVVFKPVDFVPLRKRILETVSEKFNGVSIAFDDDVLDRIVAGVWLSDVKVEDWAENVLAPGISKLRSKMNFDKGACVRLSAVEISGQQLTGRWLPSEVRLAGTCLNI